MRREERRDEIIKAKWGKTQSSKTWYYEGCQ